jgi:hypothetical protein
MRTIAIDSPERHCRCGALLEYEMTRCRKCRARSRWYRHKSRRSRPARPGRRRAGTAPRGR